MKDVHVEVGVCGLSCRLCPAYHRETKSRCPGCKSEFRMGASCAFLNCAFKKKGLEFCGFCPENGACEKWRKHREMGKRVDSFVSYQALEDNISFIEKNGLPEFEKQQISREKILNSMLSEFNEGRSKSLYCIAATILEIKDLEIILREARKKTYKMALKEKSQVLRELLSETAIRKKLELKLRK
jgi:hypothetical protein